MSFDLKVGFHDVISEQVKRGGIIRRSLTLNVIPPAPRFTVRIVLIRNHLVGKNELKHVMKLDIYSQDKIKDGQTNVRQRRMYGHCRY